MTAGPDPTKVSFRAFDEGAAAEVVLDLSLVASASRRARPDGHADLEIRFKDGTVACHKVEPMAAVNVCERVRSLNTGGA